MVVNFIEAILTASIPTLNKKFKSIYPGIHFTIRSDNVLKTSYLCMSIDEKTIRYVAITQSDMVSNFNSVEKTMDFCNMLNEELNPIFDELKKEKRKCFMNHILKLNTKE